MSELWTLSAGEIAAGIARGEISSSDAVTAHIARIEAVDPLVNAVVVRRYDAALAEARAADERRARGEPLGALHGVPVSVKECLDVTGTPSTFGLPSRANHSAVADDPSVARWRAAGAIVVAKTNVPQLMVFIETDNPLFGRTNNPWNLERSPGGSSGGEAALIAAGGSPLGLGTDIGGSLRSPATSCGIVSLKPTTGRLNDTTRLEPFAGQRAIISSEGPLARTVADVALGLELANGGRDPAVLPPRPLRDPAAIDVRGLRVGYYERTGWFRASPALERAAREAAGALSELGATVVHFDPPAVDEAMDLFYRILSADGGRGFAEALGKDQRDSRVAELLTIASKPRALLAGLERLLALAGQRGPARLVHNFGFTATADYWKVTAALERYRERFALALDGAAGGPLDLIVSPPCGLPALRHGASADVSTAGAYAPLYNVLGYPAGTLPWTQVLANEETARKPSSDRIERAALATERGSTGLPAGVQIVGRPWREDVVLAAMFALETVARGRPDFPLTPVSPQEPVMPEG
jgi:fatty acid amide hydrolase